MDNTLTKELTRQRAFDGYDKNNPEIWNSFKAFCLWLWDVGARSYSAQDAVAILRFQRRYGATIGIDNGEGVILTAPAPTMPLIKFQRNYIMFYARKLAQEDPRFENFFDFSKS